MEVKKMDIGEITSDAIKYPTSDWTKIIILAVILLIPIVNFIGLGYILRMLKGTLAGLDDLPEFDEVGEMFIDGLKILIVGIVYAIPIWIIALIFGLIASAIFPASTTTYIGTDSTAMLFGLIGSYAIFLIVALIVGLVEIMAIVNMAYYDGDLGAAFRFSEILDYISRIGWGKYILTYIVIALVSTIIVIAAMFIGIILLFVGIFITLPIAMSYTSMFGTRAIALLFADGLSEEVEAIG
jgi:hypothetical protein